MVPRGRQAALSWRSAGSPDGLPQLTTSLDRCSGKNPERSWSGHGTPPRMVRRAVLRARLLHRGSARAAATAWETRRHARRRARPHPRRPGRAVVGHPCGAWARTPSRCWWSTWSTLSGSPTSRHPILATAGVKGAQQKAHVVQRGRVVELSIGVEDRPGGADRHHRLERVRADHPQHGVGEGSRGPVQRVLQLPGDGAVVLGRRDQHPVRAVNRSAQPRYRGRRRLGSGDLSSRPATSAGWQTPGGRVHRPRAATTGHGIPLGPIVGACPGSRPLLSCRTPRGRSWPTST